MKKMTDVYFKQNSAAVPIKSPYPDSRSANRIQSTRSPSHANEVEFRMSSNQFTTPTKIAKNSYRNQNESTSHQLFNSNRMGSGRQDFQHDNLSSSFSGKRQKECNCSQNCHMHSHRNDQEVVNELKKMIMMINGTSDQINSTEPQNQEIRQQIQLLGRQNQRLLSLVQALQIKAEEANQHSKGQLESEISILRNQLNQISFDKQRETQELQKANFALTSQLRSFEERVKSLEKQNDSLRYLLREKEENEQAREAETKRKNQNEKLSLKMIKEQYSETLKAMQGNLSYQIESKSHSLEQQNLEHRARVSELENRIRVLENVANSQNRSLLQQNKRLRARCNDLESQISRLQQKVSCIVVFPSEKQDRLNQLEKQVLIKSNEINNLLSKVSSLEMLLQERKREHEMQIQGLQAETEQKVKLLMENYEQQIKILKKQIKNSEGLAQQNRKLKTQNQQLQNKISILNQKIQQLNIKINEMTESKESSFYILKNKYDALERQNDMLNDEIGKLNNQIYNLQIQNKNLKSLPIRDEEEIEEKDNKIFQLEMTIRNLNKIMEETEIKIKSFEENAIRLSIENDKLNRARDHEKVDYDTKVNQLNSHWIHKIDTLKQEHSEEISNLFVRIRQSEEKERQLVQKMTSHLSMIRQDGIRQQLIEIKKLVEQGKFESFQCQLSKISEQYTRELIRSEEKTMQIDQLIKQKCYLEDNMAEKDRIKLVLEEKINILEGNTKIIEGELKERKSLCESLINQKTILQKEILMLKKVRLDKQSIESTKAKARQISMKIDKLLAIQEERDNSRVYITTTTSRFTKGNFE